MSVLLIGLPLQGAPFSAPELEFFEKKVRPTLAAKCYSCHSHEAEKLKAGLYLDSRAGVLAGGDSGPAAVPGDAMGSRLLTAIEYGDVDLQMPPKSKLSEEQINDLRQWIALGLPWPEESAPSGKGEKETFDLAKRRANHWAWQPVSVHQPPPVGNSAWPRNPIDAFILRDLEREGLAPAPEASRRSLIRRLAFGLTGLPPTPKQIADFQKDYHHQAYDRVVDDFLSSPQFGERWARHWLDLVRYAETMGHEFDYAIPFAWRYRDYVIRAMNSDVPYDQFVREHIAGDLLRPARLDPATGHNESVVGTGFYWLGQQVHSPVDIEMNQLEVIDNQIDVLSKTFLGMTVSCARCHDHKFDAISTKDFYAFFGVLSSSRYHEAAVEHGAVWDKALTSLKQQNDTARERAAAAWAAGAEDIAQYLQTGLKVLFAESATRADDAAQTAGLVLEDFESGLSENWEKDAASFATSVEPLQENGSSAPVGEHFGVSRNKGKLLSRSFTIEHDYLHFLIAGSSDRRRGAVRLLVDGRTVGMATGRKDKQFRPARFELRGFRGREARIELHDGGDGEWDFIAADHFVFSSQKEFFGRANRFLPSMATVQAAAEEASLDPALLRRWIVALDESVEEDPTRHPLALLTQVPATKPATKKVSFREHWEAASKKYFVAQEKEPTTRGTEMASAAGGGFANWFFDGPALREARMQPGDLNLAGFGRGVTVATDAAIHSARLSKFLQGSLRSPTFTIDDRYLHVLAAGEGSRINVVIENFNLIRSPIYGGLKRQLNQVDARWVTFDLNMWVGHEAYLEFKDTKPSDLAGRGSDYRDDGWFSVTRVVTSPESRMDTPRNDVAAYLHALVESPDDPAAASQAIGQHTRALIERWGGKGEETEARPLTANDYQWLAWLAERDLLLGAEQGDASFAAARTAYQMAAAAVDRPILVPSMTEGSGLDHVVWVRGNPRMEGPSVSRGMLEALRKESDSFVNGSGRESLAAQIADAENPLTARVYVNRVWHQLFGRGIVATPDNFGVLGELPTHPELLDWLAHWFVTEGQWSTKQLIRLLVYSNTYRMASATDVYYDERDPTNKWFHKMAVRRLEGESIRDAILQVSGDLNLEQGGPSVPVYLTPFMTGRGRPRSSGPLDGAHRRSVYQEVRRNFLSPMMLAFDAPVPHTTFGKRSVSNVPAQALILMNDPFVLHQAKRWASRMLEQAPELGTRERIRRVFLEAIGRAPTREEWQRATAFVAAQQAAYGDGAEAEVQVWADFCHVAFNVKEFIFLD